MVQVCWILDNSVVIARADRDYPYPLAAVPAPLAQTNDDVIRNVLHVFSFELGFNSKRAKERPRPQPPVWLRLRACPFNHRGDVLLVLLTIGVK